MIDTLGMPDWLLSVAVIVLALIIYSRLRASTISAIYPPVGEIAHVDGRSVHFVDIPADRADAPAIVFIHGASGNLHDPMVALRGRLEGRYRLIFVDRPGHGWTERFGRGDAEPARQAAMIAGLLEYLGIGKAVIAGHSWGGSVAAAFAVAHPEKTGGLVFLAPATHPWKGGVNWYYHVAATPVLGHFFTEILALPVGKLLRDRTIRCVFAPEFVPDDYAETACIDLTLRPATFRANAQDIAHLHEYVSAIEPRYRDIAAPCAIVADDADPVVYTHIHSVGLERDIDGARLIRVEGAGHMPHHTRSETVVSAIEAVLLAAGGNNASDDAVTARADEGNAQHVG